MAPSARLAFIPGICLLDKDASAFVDSAHDRVASPRTGTCDPCPAGGSSIHLYQHLYRNITDRETSVPPRANRVREPIQVHLTRAERAALDRLARELGVSRAEVLRRGMEMLARHRPRSFHDVFDALVGTFSSPSAPTDLAERHDDHAPDDLERRSSRFRRRSS